MTLKGGEKEETKQSGLLGAKRWRVGGREERGGEESGDQDVERKLLVKVFPNE